MSSVSYDIFLTASFLLITLLNLLLPVSCIDESLLSSSEGMLVEDKARLGSAPPNCHNRCYECTPCTAVQDPTSPAAGSNPIGSNRVEAVRQSDEYSFSKDKYSNYKPLGWKCRCGDHLYNP